MKSNEIKKPNFLQVLLRRGTTLEKWLQTNNVQSTEDALRSLQNEYSLTSDDLLMIDMWTSANRQTSQLFSKDENEVEDQDGEETLEKVFSLEDTSSVQEDQGEEVVETADQVKNKKRKRS